MRNLLGRLHARRLPELLRIADAWGVPLHVDNKGEVVATLYRAMTDQRTVRDVWDRLPEAERAVAAVLADAPDGAGAPTVAELATRLGVAEDEARETALGLYRAGLLAREGDDEPLPIGAAPRLLMPREVALNIRRIEDEMAAGDLAQAPLRVLVELLDDAELEAAARTWGLRTLPGVARRQDLVSRLLRLVNDRERVGRVAASRSRDAIAIWRIMRGPSGPLSLSDAAVRSGLGGMDKVTVARLRVALAELEGSLLVWHAYRRDGTRWLFVPPEIRNPGEAPATALPPLEIATLEAHEAPAWHHPDAVAWDLLTLLRILSNPQAPVWEGSEPPPRWLLRALATRSWFGSHEGLPTGYIELLHHLAIAERVLAIDEEARPPRIESGPQARAWRGETFATETMRLRERWLHLPHWIEGEPAGIVEVWGADWRGMRPRLLAALADPNFGLEPEAWVTLDSLVARIAAGFPALLGPSFTAATARLGGEAGAGVDEDEARRAALSDVIAFELAGPFAWFGLTSVLDRVRQSRLIRLTRVGAAVTAQEPMAVDEVGEAGAALLVDPGGEVTLQWPSPNRVWALSAFTEPVDLGPQSHYRLTPDSIALALGSGIERAQIVAFLERGSGRPLPDELAANLAAWARSYRRVGLQRAVVLRLDEASQCGALMHRLREDGWPVEAHHSSSLLVTLDGDGASGERDEGHLVAAIRAAGFAPHWAADASDAAEQSGTLSMAIDDPTRSRDG
jgi:hypothetical protein